MLRTSKLTKKKNKTSNEMNTLKAQFTEAWWQDIQNGIAEQWNSKGMNKNKILIKLANESHNMCV